MTGIIKALPPHQRPRERLLRGDGKWLTDIELLAVLIGSGNKERDVVRLAGDLLEGAGGFRRLAEMPAGEVLKMSGMGSANTARIMAAFEIGRRFREERIFKDNIKITSAGDVAYVFMPKMRDLKDEIFLCLFLDGKKRIMDVREITHGTPVSAAPSIRLIASEALRRHAASILCMHNHPSGDPTPSAEDIGFTEELATTVRKLDVDMLDHIIFGNDIYVSLREKGLFTYQKS